MNEFKVTNRVIDKENKTIGYRFEDSGEGFATCTENMYSKTIVEMLMGAHYKFFGDYVFADNKGNLISTLPEMPFAELSDTDKEYFYEPDPECYTEAQMKQYLSKEDASVLNNAVTFRQPVKYIINTMGELTEYLSVSKSSFNRNDLRYFMPINAFTNPEVLISIEDFNSSKYSTLVASAYNSNQCLTIDQMSQFLNYVKDNYSAEINDFNDIMSEWYAWGLPLIGERILEKKETMSDTIFRVNATNGAYIGLPSDRVYDFAGQFVSRDGNTVIGGDDSYIQLKSDTIGVDRQVVQDSEYVFEFMAKPLKAKIIEYKTTGYTFFVSAITVGWVNYSGKHSFKSLSMNILNNIAAPLTLWNVADDNVKTELYRYLIARSFAEKLIQATADNTDISTYRLYRQCNMSHPAALRRMLYEYRNIYFDSKVLNVDHTLAIKPQFSTDFNLSDAEDDVLTDMKLNPDLYVGELMYDTYRLREDYKLSEWDTPFKTEVNLEDDTLPAAYARLYNRFMSGELLTGILASKLTAVEDLIKARLYYTQYFYQAMKLLNVTESEIQNAIDSIEVKELEITDTGFDGNLFVMTNNYAIIHLGGSVTTRLVVKNRLNTYSACLLEEKARMARDARYWFVIDSVLKESTSYERAVAVKGVYYDTEGLRTSGILTILRNALDEEIHVSDDYLWSYYFATLITKIHTGNYTVNGNVIQITTPLQKVRGIRTITLPRSIITALQDYKMNAMELTSTLCDNVARYELGRLKINFYVTNARVNPYTVVPMKGYTFPCTDLSMAFSFGYDLHPQHYAKYKTGVSPWRDPNAMECSLANAYSPSCPQYDEMLYHSATDWDPEFSVMEYLKNVKYENNEWKLLQHPYDIKYPEVYKYLDIHYDKMQLNRYNVIDNNAWQSDITGEMIKFGYFNAMLKKIEKSVEYGSKLPSHMLICFDEGSYIDALASITEPLEGISLRYGTGKNLIFDDNTTIPVSAISDIDTAKYRVRQLTAVNYLVGSHNSLYFVTLAD